MTPTILITGATGNVGLQAIRALPADTAVRAAVYNPTRTQGMLPDNAHPVQFDFTNPATYDEALAGIKRMLLVRPPQISNVKRDMAPFIAAAAAAGVQHTVFLSVMGAEDVGFIPHAKIETLLRESGMDWTFLRPGFFNQNLSTTHAADIREHDRIFVPAGGGKTSFIDVRDIGAVAARALTEDGHTGEAYTLTGKEALTYDEVATILSDVLGRKIRYARPNPLRFAWKEWRGGTPLAYVGVMAGIYLPTYFGQTGDLTDTTEQILDREPIRFREFAEEARAAWE